MRETYAITVKVLLAENLTNFYCYVHSNTVIAILEKTSHFHLHG